MNVDMTAGTVHETNKSGSVVVIEYINAYNVKIMFLEDGSEKVVNSNDLRAGKVKNLFKPSCNGVGYLGVYDKTTTSKRCKSTWSHMLERCYNEKYREKYKSYEGCTVNQEWHSLANFSKFFHNCPYRQDNWSLDKDLIERGNREYCKETCAFVPNEINSSVVFSERLRGEYPLGVIRNGVVNAKNPFHARVTDTDGGKVISGWFNTEEEAFYFYKHHKEARLKALAKKWSGLVDPRVSFALENWKIYDSVTGMGV